MESKLMATSDTHGYQRFAVCGFSKRTTIVLIKAGIDAPERLLSMAPGHIRLIPGIGETLMKEIDQYRARGTGSGVTERWVGSPEGVKRRS